MDIKIKVELTFLEQLKKLLWFHQDRCEECGGELEEKVPGVYACKKCGKKN